MPNIFEEITAISSAIIGASLVALIVFLLVAAARARTAGKRFEEKLQQAVDDLKPLPILVRRGLQPAQVVRERQVVWIVSSRFDDGDDSVRPHESRDVIDVAMRVVAVDTASEPDNVVDTEEVCENLLDPIAIKRWVAGLGFAEQAFFGC